jgi:nitrate reductase cytochrome c-type subunit
MKTLIFSTAALALVGTLSFGIQGAWSDDDDHSYSTENWKKMKARSTGVAPVTNALYAEECGSCHYAYQPGLLPASSWQQVMTGLADHFGDNAELDTQDEQQLTEYLTSNAADTSSYRRSRKIMNSLQNTNMPPLRITEIPYFKHEHREIPKRIINLPEVGGNLSQCNSCHQRAEKGSFNEREISIKGFGRWED